MEVIPKTALVYFLFFFFNTKPICAEDSNNLVLDLSTFQEKLSVATNYIVSWLEDFNDLGRSDLGKMIGYEEMKPKTGHSLKSGRMKKMGMALMPMIFHVGAISTWLLITGILAAKSVAIGLLLLVFKIAVSSAKVASFFTLLKSKHGHHEHSWTPHLEHHGYERSLSERGSYYPAEWNSHIPEPLEISAPTYKTIPKYKSTDEVYLDDESKPPTPFTDRWD